MIISKTSPLLNVPEGIDAPSLLILDGLRHAGMQAELAFLSLESQLLHISTQERIENTYTIVRAFSFAWSFIDAANQLRECLWYLTRKDHEKFSVAAMLPQELKELIVLPKIDIKQFLDNTSHIKDTRNIYQHSIKFRESFLKNKRPIWGSLRWLHIPNREETNWTTFTLLSGHLFGEVQAVITLPKEGEAFHIPIGKIVLDEKRTEVNISYTMVMIEKVIRGIEEQLKPQFADKKPLDRDMLFKICYKLTPKPDNNSDLPEHCEIVLPTHPTHRKNNHDNSRYSRTDENSGVLYSKKQDNIASRDGS